MRESPPPKKEDFASSAPSLRGEPEANSNRSASFAGSTGSKTKLFHYPFTNASHADIHRMVNEDRSLDGCISNDAFTYPSPLPFEALSIRTDFDTDTPDLSKLRSDSWSPSPVSSTSVRKGKRNASETWARISGNNASSITQQSETPSSLSVDKIAKISMAKTQDPKEENRLPAWDRAVDVATGKAAPGANSAGAGAIRFAQALSKFRALDQNVRRSRSRSRYLRLPDAVRFRIASCLIAGSDQDKTILLNAKGTEKPVWPKGHFICLADVLDAVGNYLDTGPGMRADIMAAIYTNFRFHAIFSPYIRQILNPLPTKFLNEYVGVMQRVTVEIDLTKLGCGPTWEATRMGSGTTQIKKLIDGFVEGMQAHKREPPMESLTVVCRRFHGNRPGPNPLETADGRDKEVPYVPDDVLAVADGLRQLTSLVETMRVVGFSEKWTADTVLQAQKDSTTGANGGSNIDVKRRCPSDLFPLVPGQSSVFDYGSKQGGLQLREHLDVAGEGAMDERPSTSDESVKTVQQTPPSPLSEISDKKPDRKRFGRLFE